VAYSEIEKFPSAVLAHHYPDVPNIGDMTKFKEWNLDHPIDLLVGGTPCQSFSVAGLRKGLEDPRGNLALVYCGILDHFRPQWFVWENVPGVLSSNGGRDFGSFLGALAELGYGFAYRVLDAQYFGVAQRRRRVFVVGYLGDWRPAAEVLFERESVRGDSAPSREKRKETTSNFRAGIASGSDPELMTTLCATDADKWGSNQWVKEGKAILSPIALAENTIGRQPHNGGNGDGFTEGGPMYTLNATGVHGVAQPIPLDMMNIRERPSDDGRANRIGRGYGEVGDPMFTITKANHHAVAQPIAFAQNQRDEVRIMQVAGALAAEPGMKQQTYLAQPVYMGNAEGGAKEVPFLTCHNLGGTAGISNQTPLIGQPITFSGQMSVPQTDVDMSATLQAKNPMAVAQPMAFTCSEQSNSFAWEKPYAPTITAQIASDTSNIQKGVRVGMAVRRLTPVECERLQGFPDNYTNIPWRKAAESSDGPRYKALGNSMAVPVMAWIGKRIADYEQQTN
jgi:DNA (cytosine-5)-methyltransferase 1